MAEDAKTAADAANAKLDSILDSIKSVGARMDAFEAADRARKDAEREEREDRARRDAEQRAREDKARRDADRFSARKDGETDEEFKRRHDADEESMAKDLTASGEPEESAKDKARKARHDAETAEEKRALEKANEAREREDRAKKDAETEEEKRALAKADELREREDKARKDALTAENSTLRDRLAAMETKLAGLAQLTREVSADERNALAAAQARADSIASLFGERVSAALPGETPQSYRRRLLAKFQKHSARFKDVPLNQLDGAVLDAIEKDIYADAQIAAKNPATPRVGVLVPYQETDPAGRTITKFYGDPLAWMAPFMTGAQVGTFNRHPNARN